MIGPQTLRPGAAGWGEDLQLSRKKGCSMPDLVALGECMVEFYSDAPLARARTFTKTLGADTLNTPGYGRPIGLFRGLCK